MFSLSEIFLKPREAQFIDVVDVQPVSIEAQHREAMHVLAVRPWPLVNLHHRHVGKLHAAVRHSLGNRTVTDAAPLNPLVFAVDDRLVLVPPEPREYLTEQRLNLLVELPIEGARLER